MKRWQLVKPLRAAIRAGHPWIYDRALAPPPRGVEPGDVVEIVDEDGPVAIAFADPASPIRARVLELIGDGSSSGGSSPGSRASSGAGSRGPKSAASARSSNPASSGASATSSGAMRSSNPASSGATATSSGAMRPSGPRAVDGDWVRARVEAAAARRARDPRLAGCTGRRLVHGEGDSCPGLVVDQYDDTAVIVFDGRAASAFWRPYLDAMLDGLERGHGPIARAWLRATRGAGRDARASDGAMAVRGDPPAEIEIAEDEARFGVDVRSGQKTGFFLDQRENRRTIRAHAAGATVLNVFCYTGGFSLHAALGGATRVTSVDIAAPAIASLQRNLERTGLSADAHELVTSDAFELFARAERQGRRWDLVIVDPPSFAPSERAKQAALGAYRKLAQAALAVVEPGGRFALASCSSHITESDLLDIVAPLGPTRLRHVAGAASDHPVLPGFPEGRYLKFLFFDVG